MLWLVSIGLFMRLSIGVYVILLISIIGLCSNMSSNNILHWVGILFGIKHLNYHQHLLSLDKSNCMKMRAWEISPFYCLGHNDEQSSPSGQEYASDRSAIMAGSSEWCVLWQKFIWKTYAVVIKSYMVFQLTSWPLALDDL